MGLGEESLESSTKLWLTSKNSSCNLWIGIFFLTSTGFEFIWQQGDWKVVDHACNPSAIQINTSTIGWLAHCKFGNERY